MSRTLKMKIASPYMAITWHHCQRRINKTMPEECTLPEVKFTFSGFVPVQLKNEEDLKNKDNLKNKNNFKNADFIKN